MLLATESHLSSSLLSTRDIPESSVSSSIPFDQHKQYEMIPRKSSIVSFGRAKISIALTKKFVAKNGGAGAVTARRHGISLTTGCCDRGYAEQIELSLIQNGQNWNAAIAGVPASAVCRGAITRSYG